MYARCLVLCSAINESLPLFSSKLLLITTIPIPFLGTSLSIFMLCFQLSL